MPLAVEEKDFNFLYSFIKDSISTPLSRQDTKIIKDRYTKYLVFFES